MRTCSVPSCDRPHKSKGFCTPHYYRWRRHGDPQANVPIREAGGRRSVEGPPVEHVDLGRAGDFTPEACSVAGCGREQLAQGFCRGHYRRWLEHADPQPDVPFKRAPTYCEVDGCGREAEGRGLCLVHWQRWRKRVQR